VNSKDIEQIYTNYKIENGIYSEINQSNDVERIRDKWMVFSLSNKKMNKIEITSSINGRYSNEKNCAA
jgi:hypothetical protein